MRGEARLPVVQSRGASTLTPLKVLLVEDAPADAELIVSALRRAGYLTSHKVVNTPEEFQQALGKQSWDVVLSDHNLQSWTATEALEIIQDGHAAIPLIVVTGSLGEERAVEYLKEGANDYVLKDHLEKLPGAVARALVERRQRDENLELQRLIGEEKDDWKRTFDAIPMSIVLLDSDHRIVRANRASEVIFGIPVADAIGRQCFTLVHKDGKIPDNCVFCSSLAGECATEIDTPLDCRGRLYQVQATPRFDAHNNLNGVIHVMQDITDRVRLEQELQQAKKLEAVGCLAGGIAHDFNNLLMVISGSAELLEKKVPDTHRTHLSNITKATERAAWLTSQLLSFSRKQVVQPRTISVNNAIGDLNKMLRRIIREDIAIVSDFGDGLPPIFIDPRQFEQIIINLSTNARDAMPNGGTLTISTGKADIGGGDRVMSWMPGTYTRVSVSDTGIGMTAEVQDKIFEPFFTTKEVGHGTGLGLATVYGIVKDAKGYMKVTSIPNAGTTFEIYFPAHQEVPRVAVPDIVQDTEALAGHETILVVEDDDDLRSLTSEFLSSCGYRTLAAKGVEDALRLVDEAHGDIQLAVMDVVLSKLSGPELADMIRIRYPATRVLFVSSYADNPRIRRLLDAGAEFLQKPVSRSTLVNKVSSMLRNGPMPGIPQPEFAEVRPLQ